MIPADQKELITAAVDGELSATEARAFRRLLDNSAEARATYAKLRADRDRVRSLPLAMPPADLHAKIIARIASATPAPTPAPTRKPAARPAEPAQPFPFRRTPVWVPVAVAAGLLLCITAGSFAFFNSQSGAKNQVAKHPWSDALPAQQDTPTTVPSPNAIAPQDPARLDPDAVVHSDVSPVPPLPLPVPPAAVAVAPEPRSAPLELHGSPLLPKLPPFDLVRVRVPFLRTVAELDREDIRQELADELGRDPTFRFDLFVRDTARGAEVFQNAAKAAGLTVFADASTLDKLKKKQAHAVVIYTEALTAKELIDLFAKVCAEDAKFSPRVCDSMHATPVHRSDELELKAILGVDVGLFKRPVGSGGSGINGAGQGGEKGEKSVSAGTIDSVAKSLTTPPAKPGDKPAVLLTWQTTSPTIARTNPSVSAELKQFQQFLAKRGTRPANAIPAIIVIRPVG